jgi:hypothetical protein
MTRTRLILTIAAALYLAALLPNLPGAIEAVALVLGVN